MLTPLGFLLYCVLFIFLLHRLNRHKTVRLTSTELTLAFGFKVLMGCLYGYVFLHFYGGDDTWAYHQESIDEYHELFRDPALFFGDLSPTRYFREPNTFAEAFGLYKLNLERQLLFKTMAVVNIISGSNYYINIVFFNFIVFRGHYWLFTLLVKEFPAKRKWLFLLIFFFPPVVFWLSGIRGDGLLLFFIGLCLFHFHRWLQNRKTGSLLLTLLALLGVFIFRTELVMLLLPALLAWGISVRYKKKAAPVFVVTYAIGCLLFFGTLLLSPTKNLPGMVAHTQHKFFSLKANTRLPLDSLQPDFTSYVRVAPQALGNTFLRPFPWEAKGFLQLISSADIVFFWLLVIVAFFRKDPRRKEYLSNPVVLVLLFFGISLYLFIGYAIPFPGAIVRYKIIGELFLLTAVILNINWHRERQITKKIHI